MKKFIMFLTFLLLTSIALGSTSAFDIEWWNQNTYSNTRANTLRQWAEGMEGRVAGNVGTGSIFYVDSDVVNEGDGSSWLDAKDTLDEAINLCTDNSGDVIHIAQNHAETWIAANSAAVDVIGISIYGMGQGTDRPTFTYTASGEIVFSVANCLISNVVFSPGADTCTHAIEITAAGDGTIIENCEFTDGATATWEFADAIDVASGADDLTIRFNRQIETSSAAVSWLDLSAGACDNLQVYGNNIYGDYSTSLVSGSTHAHLLGYWGYNTMTNVNTAELVLDFQGNATGVIEHNRIFADTQAALDPGTMMCFENYVSTVIDTSGQIYPAPDDGTTQLNATSVTAIATAVDNLAGIGMIGLCDENVTTTTVDSAALGGFGDSAFIEGWSLICIFDTAGAVGTEPSGSVRDITAYTSTGGVFTTAAWDAALTAGDYVLLTPTHLIPSNWDKNGPKTIYCDDGGSNGEGTSWESAKTTLAAAEAACNAGDTILIGENHNQALDAAELLNLAGLTVEGQGEGDTRPSFDYDSAVTELTLDAAGITIKNIRLIPSTSETVAAIVVGASGLGCTIDNCAFEVGEEADDEFIDCISVNAAAEGLTVKNCTAWNTNATAGAQDTFLNLDGVTVDDCTATGNTVFGTYAEACIWGADAIPVNINIQNNTLTNNTTTQFAIEFQGAATGIIANNKLAGDTYGNILDPGSARCYGNTQTVGINSGAIDVPLVAGKTYALTKADGTNDGDDLFSVTGGPILITSFTGYCVTSIGGTSIQTIVLDHASLANVEFTDAVDIASLTEGGFLFFTEANPAAITIINLGANLGASQLMDPWYCPVGMIENTDDSLTQVGVISWSMTFIPLTDGVAVVPQ